MFITRLVFVVTISFVLFVIGVSKLECDFHDVSLPVSAILCAVEQNRWAISPKSNALQNLGCLLGAKRCQSVLPVPMESQIPPSPPAPQAKNKQYHDLATT